MTAFSFFILPEKSTMIEKDRFLKHAFVKTEGKYYIFARPHAGGLIEGKRLSPDYFSFVCSIADEMESAIYLVVEELKNKEGEQDFSIKKHLNSIQTIDSEKAFVFNKETVLSYDRLYTFPFSKEEFEKNRF